MKKLLFGFLTALCAVIFLVRPVKAYDNKILLAGTSAVLRNELFIKNKDCRVEQLKKFLDFYNSPLVSETENFIKIADEYGLDWRLIPAITGVESTFGKKIPYNSFNAYGWVNGNYSFNSWDESIKQVAKTLKEKYIDRGLDTPEKIGPVYAPPSPSWASKVCYFINKIDSFKSYECLKTLTLTI